MMIAKEIKRARRAVVTVRLNRAAIHRAERRAARRALAASGDDAYMSGPYRGFSPKERHLSN
jgi:hypothetical protein